MLSWNFLLFRYHLSILFFIVTTGIAIATPDFSLVCQKGYRLTSIQRANSEYQRGVAGSLTIECQRILAGNLDQIKCEALESTPQCNGLSEGCIGSQWLGGFHAYTIENATNTVLLDPICCSSPNVQVDSLSCAHERLNLPKRPFEHRLLSYDLIYRGMNCWHQYNSTNTIVDMAWKMEICQYKIIANAVQTHHVMLADQRKLSSDPARAFGAIQRSHLQQQNQFNSHFERSQSPPIMMSDQLDPFLEEQLNEESNVVAYSKDLPSCPPCNCQCGIEACANGAKPIRLIHKAHHPYKCSCDCSCKYDCF